MCTYNPPIRFSWNERKRRDDLRLHGLDFRDAPRVFEGVTLTYEDDRIGYAEQRFVTLGLLRGMAVSLVHTETPQLIRVISFRKATNREQATLFESLQD